MGRGGEGGNEASNVEVLLFKVEVAKSMVMIYQMNIMTVRMNKFVWKQVWWSNDFTTARWSFHNRCL